MITAAVIWSQISNPEKSSDKSKLKDILQNKHVIQILKDKERLRNCLD